MVSTLGQSAETSAGPGPALEVRGLTKNYSVGRIGRQKVVRALSELDLSVEKGEVLALVGESGSGKTTFARTVAFLERPTRGEILVGGQALPRHPSTHRLREHRREVQMIFQDPYSSLDPLHSVRYSVTRPLRSFGLVPRSAEREAVEELLDQVGLVPAVNFLRRYPHELSGGQRQRVGIARALAAQPNLILADEPTSMLDVSIRLTIMNLLLDLQRNRSLSLVFITHDLGAANYMSDRIAIMYAGRVQEIGPASEVMSEPKHPYTQLLRRAAPSPENERQQETSFEAKGDPPDLTSLPPGCPFAPRCPFVQSRCQERLPELRQVAVAHRVRCVLYE
ncbi:MAG: ABC transporter ATP-binding protein [Acidimicrobiales bacterium]